LRIPGVRESDYRRQNVIRGKSAVDLLQTNEASDQQSGTGQQYDGERNFSNDQRISESATSACLACF
jgi:hypothetical protein